MAKERITIKQKRMIEAMRNSQGNVSVACDNSKTARSSHYNWMNTNSKYKEAIESVEEFNVDRSETMLHANISKGNQRAIEFHLDRKGKSRGYGKTIEICDVELSEDPIKQVTVIMKAMASGKMSFQMGDRLMKAAQLGVDMIDQVETQKRLKRIEDMLDAKDQN